LRQFLSAQCSVSVLQTTTGKISLFVLQKQNWERLSNQVMGTLAQQECVIADTNVLKLAVLSSSEGFVFVI